MGDDRQAFAAMRVAGVNVVAAIHAASIHVHFAAIREGVFDGVGIEVLVHIGLTTGVGLVVASAEGLGFDGPIIFHPAKVVNVMDIEVVEAAAAGPKETVEVTNLPEQFAGAAGPLGRES